MVNAEYQSTFQPSLGQTSLDVSAKTEPPPFAPAQAVLQLTHSVPAFKSVLGCGFNRNILNVGFSLEAINGQ